MKINEIKNELEVNPGGTSGLVIRIGMTVGKPKKYTKP